MTKACSAGDQWPDRAKERQWTLRTGCEALGLERYEAAFRENDVDAELLPNLTADDLKEIGITSLGHRRRLLEAIAALRLESAPAGDPVRLSSASADRPDRGASPRLQANAASSP